SGFGPVVDRLSAGGAITAPSTTGALACRLVPMPRRRYRRLGNSRTGPRQIIVQSLRPSIHLLRLAAHQPQIMACDSNFVAAFADEHAMLGQQKVAAGDAAGVVGKADQDEIRLRWKQGNAVQALQALPHVMAILPDARQAGAKGIEVVVQG